MQQVRGVTPDCELIGPYVLDAVTPAERAEFELHLDGCDRCTAELGSLYEVTAFLGSVNAVAPPTELRAQILDRIPDAAQLPPLAVSQGDPRSEPVELDQRRLLSRRRALRWTLAAATIGVVGAGAVGTVSGWRTANERAAALADRQALLAAPDAQLLPVGFKDGGQGSYLVSEQQNRALFVADQLPPLPGGKLFQQWTIVGGTPVPNVTFTSAADPIWLAGTIRGADALALSIESSSVAATQPTADEIQGVAEL